MTRTFSQGRTHRLEVRSELLAVRLVDNTISDGEASSPLLVDVGKVLVRRVKDVVDELEACVVDQGDRRSAPAAPQGSSGGQTTSYPPYLSSSKPLTSMDLLSAPWITLAVMSEDILGDKCTFL